MDSFLSQHPDRPQWFAPPGIETERNVYFRARAELKLPFLPPCHEIQIAAESWYRLWCNDQEVATGPARGTSTLAFFDTLDLAPFLQTGSNKLDVLVHCANIPTFKAAPTRPALWIGAGSTPLKWQVAHDGSFDATSPLYTFQIGFCEWRDLREDIFDWQAPKFFAFDKELLPRDCAMPDVTTHSSHQEFPATIEAGEALVLDFEHEITGGAEIESEAAAGAQIEIGYAEHLTDGCVQTQFRDASGMVFNTFADRFILRAGRQTVGPTLQERGFRFLQITNQSANAAIVHQVCAVDRRHPLPAPTFHCEDEKMQRLYEVAHHTLSSCATDVITDCPWREQALWMNDLVVNAPFWLEAGGDPRLVARCLRLALSERNANGLIYGVCPNGGKQGTVFLATNAFLPSILLELSKHDKTLAREFLPSVSEVMEALSQFSDGDGLLLGPPQFWNFLEWSFSFNGWNWDGRVCASVNWFYVLALDAMAVLTGAKEWQARADNIAETLHARFWDDRSEQYLEFENENKVSEIAQALACLSQRNDTITKVLCKKLARDNPDWLKSELYMMHFVLCALIENDYIARNRI